jgi:hypothetical protein
MRLINDAIEFISGIHVAMTKVELHHVSRKSVGPILSTCLAEGVNSKLRCEFYPCPLGVNLKITTNVIDCFPSAEMAQVEAFG